MTVARSTSVFVAASILSLAAGCSQTNGGADDGAPANGTATVAKHYEGPKPEGVSSPNDAVTTTFYIPQAAIGDMYEIRTSELAMVRAKSPEVKAFARMMVDDHKKSSTLLRQFVADNPVNIAIPQNMDPRRSAMLQNLDEASDAEFESAYVGQQAAAHQEAYNLHASYANRGDYPALKKLASQILPIIAAHRKHVEALDKKFGPAAKAAPAG